MPGSATFWFAAAVLSALVGQVWLWSGPFAERQDTGRMAEVVPLAALLLVPLALVVVRDRKERDAGRCGLLPGHVELGALAFITGLLAVQVLVGGTDDGDLQVYQRIGTTVWETWRLPVEQVSEYPPLAAIFFGFVVGFDRLLPGGFGLAFGVIQLPLWALLVRVVLRRAKPWAVAATLFWPTITVFALVRYDAVPSLLLVAGLVLAARRTGATGRASFLSGVLLGLGAAIKWTPGLAILPLAVGWWRTGRRPHSLAVVAGAGVGFVVPHLPFVWESAQRHAIIEAYRFHAVRIMTAESLPFLPLHALGFAEAPLRPWRGVDTLDPNVMWVETLFIAVALVLPVAGAVLKPRHALAWAWLAPLAFVLGNRIYSPQFVITFAVLWALALGHVQASIRARVALVGLVGLVATAGWGVWPVVSPRWVALSWVLFVGMIAVTTTGLWALQHDTHPSPGPLPSPDAGSPRVVEGVR
ncbi:MAG: hypothetical protein ABGZ36_25755 [Actinomycetota bacterium]